MIWNCEAPGCCIVLIDRKPSNELQQYHFLDIKTYCNRCLASWKCWLAAGEFPGEELHQQRWTQFELWRIRPTNHHQIQTDLKFTVENLNWTQMSHKSNKNKPRPRALHFSPPWSSLWIYCFLHNMTRMKVQWFHVAGSFTYESWQLDSRGKQFRVTLQSPKEKTKYWILMSGIWLQSESFRWKN